ncbi:MAG: hypothetical protein Kow00128_12960 [Deltaproteobacteria bacterium]
MKGTIRRRTGGRQGRREEGFALVMTLVFMVILTVIGILAVEYSTTGIQVVGEVRQEAVLAQTADTGIEQVKSLLWPLHPWDTNPTISTAWASTDRLLIADTPLDSDMSNYLLTRQRYNVRLDSINGPDLLTVTASATHQDTGQIKQVEAVLHYFATNPDQAGQGADNANVIN